MQNYSNYNPSLHRGPLPLPALDSAHLWEPITAFTATGSRCKQFTSDFFIFSVRQAPGDPRPRSLQDSNPIKLKLSAHLFPSAPLVLSSHLAA